MLTAYLFCLLSGMVLISLSLNDDGGVDGEGGPLSLLFSTPFRSFGLTGFGLSGLLMQLMVRNSAGWSNHLITLTMGVGMGLLATRVLRVIGQREAKRAVAVALRNRWRRRQVPEALRDEIAPKNIIMIGATGVGKTEIARRLAKLAQAPFIKVEASKFTEVGYVGRDVESIIRDLTELSIQLVQAEEQQAVRAKAEERAEEPSRS